ncbi:uncharacterized protein LOC126295168 [Schistocerca gregaria]|uniref:uncharacterized protein LOC126295168 n=1 Tax=Schistocerca gregaria TaxID=7010 RepID=UPI00211DF277|nr:uncharacterized protein LOC126295168 [Schistocerca gregaria]
MASAQATRTRKQKCIKAKVESVRRRRILHKCTGSWFHMLKFLDHATEADESVCNIESTERESGSATPTFEEMFEHEVQEPVTCSEAQPQPLRQERPPTTRRKVTPVVATGVMVEASRLWLMLPEPCLSKETSTLPLALTSQQICVKWKKWVAGNTPLPQCTAWNGN